ncbi:MAG: inorganic phosphate transporter [Rhodospirillales bacterium]|nr:inorganic phosphate transporter [Rhodospirillales bacterium]MBT4041023.1 inorganic phosphate transporter [Rhodospirillales bacterium]MBT4626007.1 inorganic phosphate transporter [Rhodospirillales bacterium]MBT5350290.1 inorganic phosphate transporter [Rhodospirillales bacterium]MBT5520283.1 inorganic phosphate transporter [Rhodospirillales bacterium]
MEIIQEHGTLFIIIAIIFGLYMTWGIGANDVANVMGTSVGSGAITVKTAIIIAAIFEFGGAVLAGGHVTKTIRKGIIDPTPITGNPEILVFGMLASLLAAAVWLMVASTRGWPVSTTHSIVGAVVGFAVAAIGIEAVNWGKIGQIVASWVISPVIGGAIAYVLMLSIRHLILNAPNPFMAAKRWGPIYVFMVGFIIALVTMFKGLKHLNIELSVPMSFLVATLVGIIVSFLGYILIQRVKVNPDDDKEFHYASVEKVFVPMMLFTACGMAFAHGSNDVANGVGPMAAVVGLVQSGGEIAQSSELPIWILLVGGFGIIVGLATYGYKVMQTIGGKITELTPTRGFCATMAAATTVVLASRTGMPVSTTHIAVGGVIGVGLARGIGAIDLRVIGGIFLSWIITLPIGGALAALFYFTLRGMFS